ncbi:type II toxin-antitoxin system mRNA interferase toxin, RelE/StbE family [Candidatus Woesearchaeota archaeon]|nr:type II toxin-antitoxin system mRNA interferase toxin, RelE/StbE family [Candidatus Woesearchaeota archaeon]
MDYEVSLTESFLRDLRKLKNSWLENQILNKLKELEQSPERNKRLKYGLKDYYRIRIGKLRILYTVKDDKVYVEVLVKGHKYGEV